MKCPQCGRWNRATLPNCFYCGAPLPSQPAQDVSSAQNKNMPQPSASVIYSVDADGLSTTPRPDDRDRLAKEMQSFHVRRKRGEEQQKRILQESAESGFAPSGRSMLVETRSTRIYTEPNQHDTDNLTPEGQTRPGAVPAPQYRKNVPEFGYDDIEDPPAYQPLWDDRYRPRPRARGMTARSMRHVRIFGLRRFLPYIALVLLISGVLACGYLFVLKPMLNRKVPALQEQVIIYPSILNDMAAHTVRIPAEEGAQIYIKELRKSYIVTGGYAEITVADYTWYELNNDINSDTLDVTLTPYIKTSAGEQKLMDVITYTIDIPLSPLTLVTPDTTYLEVSTSPYNISFRVAQNSTVFINGEDFSSFVNTQDGYISYNATVLPTGENVFDIVVNCQYYRQNATRIVLYRAPQAVPLELAATLSDTSANQLMTIRGTTVPGATITITSDYEDLDLSHINTTGEFSFKAKFTKIGNNTITIVAERNGLSTTLNKNVYYVPYSSTYTPKAWPMDASGYIDFLNNVDTRVARTQIYLCRGTIVEILSSKPQLALMDVSDSEGNQLLVLLENMSRDTWVVGEKYRVYADAYGVYDGKPRLVARYTYEYR